MAGRVTENWAASSVTVRSPPRSSSSSRRRLGSASTASRSGPGRASDPAAVSLWLVVTLTD